uniref:G patch domain containing 3 n=1 Tax=Hucho hucho TaxID=62062 RepID=A0A4W5JC61_9TELE
MPAGNVGTTVKVFLQLIQSCRLPSRLIRKLGLAFPKTSYNRRNGNVPYQYHNTSLAPSTEESVFTIHVPFLVLHMIPVLLDDDRCEEWERHEALHEDVMSQERSKERLYEEEIELNWEKGGSGLVFCTDAQYWQEEEGDFDEKTADDWDVDMSGHSLHTDGGDMDSRDYVHMRYEKTLREGLEDRSGGQDQPIGNSQAGIPEALEKEGQHPKCKRGFGYHGEKLSSYFVKKAKSDLCISTVYDKPKVQRLADRWQHWAKKMTTLYLCFYNFSYCYYYLFPLELMLCLY